MMQRARWLILAIGLAVLSWPVESAAQQPGKIPKIGVLLASSPTTAAPFIEVGRAALRERGTRRDATSRSSTAMRPDNWTCFPAWPRSWSD